MNTTKKLYTRKEVIELLFKCNLEIDYPETYYEPCDTDENNNKLFKEMMNEWIKENLQ